MIAMRSLFAATAAAILLTGCSTVSNINPFGPRDDRMDAITAFEDARA